jgi:uncharacterized membrane protein
MEGPFRHGTALLISSRGRGAIMADNEGHFSKARLEAFSDGVIAVIITIMVLDLKAPETAEPGALFGLWRSF